MGSHQEEINTKIPLFVFYLKNQRLRSNIYCLIPTQIHCVESGLIGKGVTFTGLILIIAVLIAVLLTFPHGNLILLLDLTGIGYALMFGGIEFNSILLKGVQGSTVRVVRKTGYNIGAAVFRGITVYVLSDDYIQTGNILKISGRKFAREAYVGFLYTGDKASTDNTNCSI